MQFFNPSLISLFALTYVYEVSITIGAMKKGAINRVKKIILVSFIRKDLSF